MAVEVCGILYEYFARKGQSFFLTPYAKPHQHTMTALKTDETIQQLIWLKWSISRGNKNVMPRLNIAD